MVEQTTVPYLEAHKRFHANLLKKEFTITVSLNQIVTGQGV